MDRRIGQDPEPAAPSKRRSGKALTIRNFRIYFFGSVISVPGPWMQMTAQAWLVLALTQSPLSLAIVTSLQFLPVMLFSLIGGAVADRFQRRRLLVLTQALGALQGVLLGTLCLMGHIDIWHIYVMAIGLGLINAVEAPLRQAFISELVPLSHLPNAIAMMSMVQNLGRIVGPALGGVVIAVLGVAAAYYINAVAFCGTIVALALLRPADMQARRMAAKQNIFFQVREGLSYARRTPSVLFLLIATAFVGLFGQNFSTMVPLISTYLVHASPAEFGILNSCLGSGSFLAAAVMTTRGAPSVRRIVLAGSCFGVVLMLISLSGNLWLSGGLFVAVGASAITFSASVNTLLQLCSPPEMRGRLISMISLLIPSPVGPMLTGAVAAALGVGWAVFLNGLCCCLGIGMAVAYLVRHRRRGHAFDYTPPQSTETGRLRNVGTPAE